MYLVNSSLVVDLTVDLPVGFLFLELERVEYNILLSLAITEAGFNLLRTQEASVFIIQYATFCKTQSEYKSTILTLIRPPGSHAQIALFAVQFNFTK